MIPAARSETKNKFVGRPHYSFGIVLRGAGEPQRGRADGPRQYFTEKGEIRYLVEVLILFRVE